MKKIVLSLLGLFSAFAVSAQTPQFVSTEPANKNVIIEEYTGINCGYCPDGHRIVREFEEDNPGRVFGINVHAGGYAAMYTTQWGNALMNQTGIQGFPSGTVNRHVFSGNATILDRGQFVSRGNQILNQSSFVNVAAQATIDATARTMTVNVEAYYTADAETASNKLNVVLLQDSIIGPQSGASANPSQVTSDGQYIHMSMLRDMITGQWGDDITAPEGSTVIPAGTLIQRTYTYNIPGSISDELVKLGHLKLVVFIARDQQEIYTGSECKPTVTNLPQLAATGLSISVKEVGCDDFVAPSLKVYNTGQNTITSMQIEYGSAWVGDDIYEWIGTLASNEEKEIELPADVKVNNGSSTEVRAKILKVNGVAISDEAQRTQVKKVVPEGSGNKLKIIIKTDQYAYECSWKLSDGNGNVLEEADYYPQQQVVRDTVEVALTEAGCYVFEIFDSYGDGGASYKIYDGSETRLVNGTASSYDDYKAINMKIWSMAVGLEEAEGAILQTLAYPNPVNDMLNLEISMLESTHANISVVDMLGREVITLGEVALATGTNRFEINTSNLSNGAYFVKIISNSGITSKKISVNR